MGVRSRWRCERGWGASRDSPGRGSPSTQGRRGNSGSGGSGGRAGRSDGRNLLPQSEHSTNAPCASTRSVSRWPSHVGHRALPALGGGRLRADGLAIAGPRSCSTSRLRLSRSTSTLRRSDSRRSHFFRSAFHVWNAWRSASHSACASISPLFSSPTQRRHTTDRRLQSSMRRTSNQVCHSWLFSGLAWQRLHLSDVWKSTGMAYRATIPSQSAHGARAMTAA